MNIRNSVTYSVTHIHFAGKMEEAEKKDLIVNHLVDDDGKAVGAVDVLRSNAGRFVNYLCALGFSEAEEAALRRK